jgi:hypothetical protein
MLLTTKRVRDTVALIQNGPYLISSPPTRAHTCGKQRTSGSSSELTAHFSSRWLTRGRPHPTPHTPQSYTGVPCN